MTTLTNPSMTNPSATVLSAGDMKFVATTNAGNTIFFGPGAILGGSGKIPNPMEYYIAAIGGCAAIKTQIDLTALGITPESISVNVDCTRREALPQTLITIHVTFTLKGRLDDAKVAAVIKD